MRCNKPGVMDVFIRGDSLVEPTYRIPLQWIEIDDKRTPFTTIISTESELFDFMFNYDISEEESVSYGEPLDAVPIPMDVGISLINDEPHERMPGEPLD